MTETGKEEMLSYRMIVRFCWKLYSYFSSNNKWVFRELCRCKGKMMLETYILIRRT